MNPEQMQQMTPDEAAASLAFATNLSEQTFGQPQMEQPEGQSQEMPQEITEPEDNFKEEIMAQLKELKDEIKGVKQSLVDDIKEALEEDDNEQKV